MLAIERDALVSEVNIVRTKLALRGYSEVESVSKGNLCSEIRFKRGDSVVRYNNGLVELYEKPGVLVTQLLAKEFVRCGVELEESDYVKYRGKCKEMSEALCAEDPTLRLVRGHYYDAFWGEQPHWWCERDDGTVVDPTKDQFPTKGAGIYVEFDGYVECANCGKQMKEEDASFDSRYAFCSTRCNMRFVGL